MFVSQAHSFKQQARLATTLAWIAGYTNIITLLACGTVTSHVSGTSSTFGRELFAGDWSLARYAAFLLVSFFIGAGISGFCTELGRRRAWQSIYVLPIVIEMGLLAIFGAILESQSSSANGSHLVLYWSAGLASAAMGLQNATITRISSGTVRTTHVTGVLTDLGHESVQFIWWIFDRRPKLATTPRREFLRSVYYHPTFRRLILLASIFSTFVLGAGLGTLAYTYLPRIAMFPPVLFMGWIIYQDITRPICEIEPSKLLNTEIEFKMPNELAVFQLRRDVGRKGPVHRLPNLLNWADRLPQGARVVILDFAEVSLIDSNATLELRALVSRFESQDRQLIISGITGEQFRNLQGAQEVIDVDNICPDIELAIARGMNLLEGTAQPGTMR